MKSHTLITDRLYVKDLFSESAFYNIPEYQRAYVWQSEQIEAFLDDISTAMDSDPDKEYFLGCMIWNTKTAEDPTGQSYQIQDILDGQQRFITMYILHAVLRDLSSNNKLAQEVQKALQQEKNEFKKIPARNRIVFDIREDEDFLEKHLIPMHATLDSKAILEYTKQKDVSISIKNIGEAILTMHKWWKNKEKENNGKLDEYIYRFYMYMVNNVLVLYLATPNNLDDAYNLFTVLNSRGIQLQTGDILRAQNLRLIESAEKRRRYALKWTDCENKISFPFKSFDEFLATIIHIQMKFQSNQNMTVLKGFENLYTRAEDKGGITKGINVIDTVVKYSNHFDFIINGRVDTGNRFFENLSFLLANTFGNQYLAVVMYYRECFGDYRITDLLIKLDNLLSALWLLGRRSMKVRNNAILKKIEALARRYQSKELTLEEAVTKLMDSSVLQYNYEHESGVFSSHFIDLEEFFNHLDCEVWGAFSGSKVKKTKYLLLKLDLLKGSLHDKLQYDSQRSSVEHLMPRKLNDAWPIDTTEHNEWVHRLGNLALVNKKKNSSLSNSAYEVKLKKYSNDIESRNNTNYIFMNYNKWDIAAIQENHKRIVDILKLWYKSNSIRAFDIVKNK